MDNVTNQYSSVENLKFMLLLTQYDYFCKHLMKIIHFIVTIFVIGFILIPCRDSGISSNQNISLSIKTTSDTHTPKQEKDGCSPFCQCACCNTPSISRITGIFMIPPLMAEITYTDILPGKILKNYISIWQPPKIVS